MIGHKKVIVVMPAYNAARTLCKTHEEVMEQGVVDLVIVVDGASQDETTSVAATLPNTVVHTHERNRGYGANQKTCYKLALEKGGDIIMIHPDYQYTPKLIPAMAHLIGNGLYDCVLGSRILGGYALKGGMPLWRYLANRFLTLVENLLMGAKLPNTIPFTGHIPAPCWRSSPSSWTRTTFCSTTRFWRRYCGLATRSQK